MGHHLSRSLGPIHSCHPSMLLCPFHGHLSAPAAACCHQGTTRGPRCPQGPCHTLSSPGLTAPACLQAPRGGDDSRAPLPPHPGGLPHPPGLLSEVWGPGTSKEGPPLPARGPPPAPPPDHILPAALRLFHQAKDCFLNKSKKLHFLLGKFILSHFISFPPIFFPNNVIK